MNQLFDKKYPVTSSLLLLTTGVFLSMLLLRGFDYESVQTVYDFGGVLGAEIQVDPSQSWRLLAAMFVHVGLQHFVLNMVTLYFLGRIAEDLFGSKAFLALYLLSGLMGNLFVLVFSPEVVAAGASTALSGLFATIVSLRFIARSPYIRYLSQRYTALILINILFSFMPGISLAGHLGGLVGGGILAFVFPVYGERDSMKKSWRWGALVLYTAGGILLYAWALLAHPFL
ncbi:rhomboid family protein [Streptococcus australis]|uniref:Peptidase, S54 family n=1 Tax=Streptococcus australis ATCC 700641 TaxID=888833 RepID=E7S916_9STRE|nr:rhomboid family intramembrane serine protease [Streptococcus australis]EFW00015.1 peptidase, S54 family [Streptococcus australis ATCC 700641]EGU63607.1 peptidase, S54 family [Streptococcus australis ATCC 700641]SQH67246.1 rhomboid family protein [Streptococcus australis]